MEIRTEYANLLLIALLPLFGSALTFVVGKKQKQLAGWIATAACLASFFLVVRLFLGLGPDVVYEHNAYNWFSVGDLSVDFTLRFDRLTAVMGLVVTGVGSLIHLYSIGYMAEDPSPHRFFSYLNLFMFSMLLLILGGNLLVLFVGWEGVGLCSYLLIGFWFKNIAFAGAGRKAFVVNRIGDAGFLLAIFFLYISFGTLDFRELSILVGNLEPGTVTALYTVVGLLLFVGAAGKSAQIPLFVWLPDAMAGPTPVSALIHAATMVTAGVYMMARVSFIYALTPFTLAIVAFIAVLTAFIAASIALTQNDIKKVLAYSTVSQLGFMFMAVAAGAYWVAVFHLVTHAFFKACLFLGSGSVIHGCHHEQDMREMGGLLKKMPITGATYGIATLAIAGIFPFAGYQSKHAILGALGANANPFLLESLNGIVFLASLTAFMTAFYMTRSFILTFLGEYRGHAHPHESPWYMTLPLLVLALLSVGGGVVLGHSLEEYLFPVWKASGTAVELSGHHGESIIAGLLHSWVGFAGIGLAFFLYMIAPKIPSKLYAGLGPISRLSNGKFYFDEIYGALIVKPLELLSFGLWRSVDQGVIDGTVNGTAAVVNVNGELVRHSQTGHTRHYALVMFLASMLILLFYMVL